MESETFTKISVTFLRLPRSTLLKAPTDLESQFQRCASNVSKTRAGSELGKNDPNIFLKCVTKDFAVMNAGPDTKRQTTMMKTIKQTRPKHSHMKIRGISLSQPNALFPVTALMIALLLFGSHACWSAGTFTLAKQLTSDDGAREDHFAYAVAVSGDIGVVGVQDDDIANKVDQGSVYLYQRNQGGNDNWGQLKKLLASDGEAQDDFGYSVAISGDLIVVGAPLDDFSRGGAYVFERNQGGSNNWGQVKKLLASDGTIGDQFGYAVAVSGDIITVGAPVDDVGSNGDQGSAYVFARNQGGSNNWGQIKRLNAADGASGDQLGFSVAISGELIVAGAVVDNGGRGSAYIFSRNQGGANNWGQVKRLSVAIGLANDWFGWSVSVSGDKILVGAPQVDIDPYIDIGAAYFFERNLGGLNNWGLTQRLTAMDGSGYDNLGVSVAVSGDVALVGATFDDVESNQDQGSAYVFWLPELRLISPGIVNGEFQVTLDGTTGLTDSLQASTDSIHWTTLTNITLSSSPMLISVPAAEPSSFYRTVTPPAP